MFGPGYGECSVIHLGGNNWIVIDSCLDTETGTPAALQYLVGIGVDPSDVKLVVATHWHDDHIRGMARQLEEFSDAIFCSSPALSNKEFVATITKFESRHGIVAGSGATELNQVLAILAARAGRTSPRRATPKREVYKVLGVSSGHGRDVSVVTLSPSDKQFDKFLHQIAEFVPLPFQAKRRAPDQSPNDLSVVVYVDFGDQALLFGGDLEEHNELELGWSAIIALDLPAKRSIAFKIPHHGSSTAHHLPVWETLLSPQPISLLTPWNRNSGLPTQSDVMRINELTDAAFITSTGSTASKRQRSHIVQKQIKETVGRLQPLQASTGWVRIRNGGARNPKIWCVECSDNAGHLSTWQPYRLSEA